MMKKMDKVRKTNKIERRLNEEINLAKWIKGTIIVIKGEKIKVEVEIEIIEIIKMKMIKSILTKNIIKKIKSIKIAKLI